MQPEGARVLARSAPALRGRSEAESEEDQKVMGSKLYIGNLAYSVTERELRDAFTNAKFDVASASVVTDKFSGQSRGFGFVELASDDQADQAISAMNGEELNGRPINVQLAKSDGPRSGGGGGRDRGDRRERRRSGW